MGIALGPKYIPYTYMDPLGDFTQAKRKFSQPTQRLSGVHNRI